jgi:Gram-negative bacterial TonB protein C-terminal
MFATARAVFPYILLIIAPAAAQAQTGPSDPEVIVGSATAKITIGGRKLTGHVIATVKVGEDGRVREVLITENTTEPGFEPQLVRVLQSARFRPAIDASGKPIEANTEMRVELRQGTSDTPKPVAAKPDPLLTDKEKARIKKMRCSDFVWEWDLIRDAASNAPVEFMPRIATTMYATLRSDAGDYVDSKVWKAAPKGLKEAADQCRDSPGALFWDGVFRSVMDEAVPK